MDNHEAKNVIAAFLNPSSGLEGGKLLLQHIENKKVRHKASKDSQEVMKK